MKGRWRILKSGVRTHGVSITDKIWLTCCALHNYLLEIDGLSEPWDGESGLHDFDEETDNIPFAIQRLSNEALDRNYDTSGMGPGFVENDSDNEDEELYPPITNETMVGFGNDLVSQGNVNNIIDLSYTVFRQKLITHFDILFSQNQIKWPQRIIH